ncbi:MAG: SDR family oxidoreductase [Rhizobiales bacterium]|nr:SDR family oxidoreductase [Hyphomicrobiales bacterium]OJU37441.1 MAG: 3-oxoacyl-ACP reductase [Rhizobiales bacterium 68-8]
MTAGRFDGQAALVTGAATGIGYEVARRIVEEGGSVALVDINGARAQESAARLGGRALGLAADVADEPSIAGAVAEAAGRFGRLDVLVNSAGITGPNVPLESYGADDWRRVMDVNINGTFFACKAAVPVMRKGGYGRIVNIASIAGKEGNPNASAYSTSKAAVIGLTKSLGKELATTEIRVNAVTPAAVKTEIFAQMTQAHIDFMLSKIPVGRFGLVEEVASLVCWLASRECSFSTGAVFDVSGGRATY